VERGAQRPGPLEDGDEGPETGGVDEVDARQVDDQRAVALEEVADRQLTDPGRGTEVELAGGGEHGDPVPVARRQPEFHHRPENYLALLARSA
jgi:hypothetical protein